MAAPPMANGCDDRGAYAPIPSKPGEKPDVLAAAKIKNDLLDQTSCVDSNAFQIFGALLIMTNALVIGLETDLGDWRYWDIVENTFLFMFTAELVSKMCVVGLCTMYWHHPDMPWNLFDTFIVSLGIFDFSMENFAHGQGTGGFATIFRIIRLLRILRIFRVLKFLKQLYVLAFGLVEAAKAVFWVTILMIFVLYVCSIVLVKTVGRPPDDDPHREFMAYRFGHILDSMLTLFILISSPNLPEYEDQKGLLQTRPFLTLFLCGFIIFGSFGIIALLTGVISQSMFEKNEVRKDMVRKEHEEMRQTLGLRCEQLFKDRVIVDENGETSVDTVKQLAPHMWKLLQAAGAEITHSDCLRIIEFMDVDGTGMIHGAEFKATMEKIAEGLSTMGIQEIASRVGVCESKIDKVGETVDALSRQNAEIVQAMNSILGRRN